MSVTRHEWEVSRDRKPVESIPVYSVLLPSDGSELAFSLPVIFQSEAIPIRVRPQNSRRRSHRRSPAGVQNGRRISELQPIGLLETQVLPERSTKVRCEVWNGCAIGTMLS